LTYECEVKEQPLQPTLSVRTRASVQELPQVLGQAYGAIYQYLCGLGEQPAGPPFTAYYNMDMQNLDIEIGFPVSKQFSGKDNIQAGEIPAGKIATCVHIGPYTDMPPAYAALSEWIKENGYEATGVAYEIYLNDPGQTPPQELMTQIVFPLQMS
jgi:effector-binding domain-containing protein